MKPSILTVLALSLVMATAVKASDETTLLIVFKSLSCLDQSY